MTTQQIIALLSAHNPDSNADLISSYVLFCKQNSVDETDEYVELHHILPRSLFPYYKSSKFNIVKLTYVNHIIAHKMLFDALKIKPTLCALRSVIVPNVGSREEVQSNNQDIITSITNTIDDNKELECEDKFNSPDPGLLQDVANRFIPSELITTIERRKIVNIIFDEMRTLTKSTNTFYLSTNSEIKSTKSKLKHLEYYGIKIAAITPREMKTRNKLNLKHGLGTIT